MQPDYASGTRCIVLPISGTRDVQGSVNAIGTTYVIGDPTHRARKHARTLTHERTHTVLTHARAHSYTHTLTHISVIMHTHTPWISRSHTHTQEKEREGPCKGYDQADTSWQLSLKTFRCQSVFWLRPLFELFEAAKRE